MMPDRKDTEPRNIKNKQKRKRVTICGSCGQVTKTEVNE